MIYVPVHMEDRFIFQQRPVGNNVRVIIDVVLSF